MPVPFDEAKFLFNDSAEQYLLFSLSQFCDEAQ